MFSGAADSHSVSDNDTSFVSYSGPLPSGSPPGSQSLPDPDTLSFFNPGSISPDAPEPQSVSDPENSSISDSGSIPSGAWESQSLPVSDCSPLCAFCSLSYFSDLRFVSSGASESLSVSDPDSSSVSDSGTISSGSEFH